MRAVPALAAQIPRSLCRALVRRWARRHGMVAVTNERLDQLTADAALLLVIEIETELIRVSGAGST